MNDLHEWFNRNAGSKKDVPKPAPITGAERMRRNRAKSPELRAKEREAKHNKRTVNATVGKTVWETMVYQLNKGVKHEQA